MFKFLPSTMRTASSEITRCLPTISLLVIDYNLLVQRDVKEIEKLLKASKELGFFYLKIHNQINPDHMFELAENVFKLPLDAKSEYEMDGKNGVYYGYKSTGTMFTDKKGTPDTVEFWNISKDEMVIQNGINFPRVILDAKNAVKDYMTKSHKIALAILEILSEGLDLDSQAFSNLHRFMQPSGDQLRLTKSTMYPIQKQCLSDVSLGAHTDFGSITILFNRLYGLQVLTTNREWLFVPPLAGHAIVNLGDAMVKLTGGRLKSNIHRVVSIPGLSHVTDRYSVVYFSRPENNVQMKSLMDDVGKESDNHVFTAQEWVARRVQNYQTKNYIDETTYEMSRGTEEHREEEIVV